PDLQVFAVPIAGGEPRDLGLETAVGAPPAISEYGVLITAGGPQARWTNKRLALLSPDASGFTFLTEPDVAAIEPAWSPDGSLIAYVAAPDLGLESGDEALAQRRIWVVAPDGTGKRQLTRGEGFRDAAPMWSRDGRYLLFARLDAEDACAE